MGVMGALNPEVEKLQVAHFTLLIIEKQSASVFSITTRTRCALPFPYSCACFKTLFNVLGAKSPPG